jgi:hypothetical protein
MRAHLRAEVAQTLSFLEPSFEVNKKYVENLLTTDCSEIFRLLT